MPDIDNFDILKQSLSKRSGLIITDLRSCEQLSIAIFLATDHYVSTLTIMQLYGLSHSRRPMNENVIGFLRDYAASV